MDSFAQDSAAQPHSYGTRKSHNLPIRPAPHLRSSPPPNQLSRRLRNSPDPSLPVFPPNHVVLHPDDASSKVFLAIGRAFLSVGNRAMTIKDLAEMVLNFGLVAQNVSAASQAITTYIRTHLQRCESQQDIPLLLRHILSGTDADDDLLPALYSRSGGAQCSAHPESRVTNFRRGTMVWYLSRATGASCPFARAGIRLSDYGENGKMLQPGNVAREKKRTKMLQRRVDDQACGQKRKRSLRSCTTVTAARDSATESETDHDRPPPKVKLTLRLKPLAKCTSSSPLLLSTQAPTNVRNIIDFTTPADPSASSSSDSESESSMSIVDDSDTQLKLLRCTGKPEEPSFNCPPPYPRRSISIPPYTPSSSDGPYPSYPATTQLYKEPYRRSPSFAYSISSPPPESDEEEEAEEEIQSSVTRSRRNFYSFSEDEDEDDEDWDEEGEVDSEADGETLWESPGPRSPSASLPETRVKEEPRDVQGMLDAWDHFDSSVAGAKVVEVIAQAAAVLNPDTIGGSATATSKVKIESQDPWDWEPPLAQQQQEWTLGMAEETIRIKQEEFDLGIDSLFPSVGDDSFELEDESLDRQCQDTIKQRAKTAPLSHVSTLSPNSSSSSSASPLITRIATPTEPISTAPHPPTLPPPISPGAAALVQLIQALSVQSPTTPTANCFPQTPDPPVQPSIAPAPPSIPPSSLVLTPTSPTLPPQQSCVSPQAMNSSLTSCKGGAEGIVVHTCQPCNPSISATQIEEISVYQMTLGPYLLLRRIDTDFVNLTPIVEWCGKGRGYPVMSTVPNAVVIGRGQGSEKVLGVWVPLEVAQAYVKDLDTHPTETEKDGIMEGLNVFLNDELVERFPSALKDFHKTNSSGRMLKQFGRRFESMVVFAQATAAANLVSTNAAVASCTVNGPLNPQKVMQGDTRQSWMQKETIVPMTDAFALGATLAIGEREKLATRSQSLLHQRQDSFSLQLHRRTGSGLKQEDCLDCVSPLSAKEQEMFQELCVIPGEEEEKMKVEEIEESRMDVEIVVEKQEEDMPKVVVNGNGAVVKVNLNVDTPATEDSDIKPVSSSLELVQEVPSLSLSSSEADECRAADADSSSKTKPIVVRTRSTRTATVSKEEQQGKPQTLRRSKRVAAAQTQQQQRTRARKRPGSRNTLS